MAQELNTSSASKQNHHSPIYKKTFLEPLFTKALKTNNTLCFANNVQFKKDRPVTAFQYHECPRETNYAANIWRLADID